MKFSFKSFTCLYLHSGISSGFNYTCYRTRSSPEKNNGSPQEDWQLHTGIQTLFNCFKDVVSVDSWLRKLNTWDVYLHLNRSIEKMNDIARSECNNFQSIIPFFPNLKFLPSGRPPSVGRHLHQLGVDDEAPFAVPQAEGGRGAAVRSISQNGEKASIPSQVSMFVVECCWVVVVLLL